MKALQVQLKTIELSDNVIPNDENTQSVSGHFKASRIVLKMLSFNFKYPFKRPFGLKEFQQEMEQTDKCTNEK